MPRVAHEGPLSRSQVISESHFAALAPSHRWNLLAGSLIVAAHSMQPTDWCYHNILGPSGSMLCVAAIVRPPGHSANPLQPRFPQHADKKRRHGLTLHIERVSLKIREITSVVKGARGCCGQRQQRLRCPQPLVSHHAEPCWRAGPVPGRLGP